MGWLMSGPAGTEKLGPDLGHSIAEIENFLTQSPCGAYFPKGKSAFECVDKGNKKAPVRRADGGQYFHAGGGCQKRT